MTVLTFEDARRVVVDEARSLRSPGSERIALLAASNRVLAQEISADRDLPPFPRATRDGYAVRAADVANIPATLRVSAEVRAGMEVTAIKIGPGECAEIMTGAAVPEGADAVVMVEYTGRDGTVDGGRSPASGKSTTVDGRRSPSTGETVTIQRGVSTGENIVPRGSEARKDQVLLGNGVRLTPPAIAIAASVGLPEIVVFKQPRVAILATGDELVDVPAHPAPHQIRNSNTYSLAAQVTRAGAVPVTLPIAADEEFALRHLIEEGLGCDLLLLSGGVSMGKYDLVEKVLHDLGAEFLFTGVHIQPGKPAVFGKASWNGDTKYFLGLPGNPVSTMVTFELFARTMIEALSGAAPTPLRYSSARLKSEVRTKTGLTRFLPAQLTGEFGNVEVELVRWQGSGDMVATARANCFAVIPPDREKIAAGETVSVLIA